MTDHLTPLEQTAIKQAGELWDTLCAVVADGPTRNADLAELIGYVHAIERAVMAQAAARAYPTTLRLLGSALLEPAPPSSTEKHHTLDHQPW